MSEEELFQAKMSDVGSCWEVLWLQGHFQRLRVDFMAGWGRDVESEDGGAEGMQTWRDQVCGGALGNISFGFFSVRVKPGWGEKNPTLWGK